MGNEIKPLTQAAPFVAELAAKVNEIAAKMRPLLNLKSDSSMEIVPSSTDVLFKAKVGGGGAVIPNGTEVGDILRWDGSSWVVLSGYAEQSITLCVDGAPTAGTILFKPTA